MDPKKDEALASGHTAEVNEPAAPGGSVLPQPEALAEEPAAKPMPVPDAEAKDPKVPKGKKVARKKAQQKRKGKKGKKVKTVPQASAPVPDKPAELPEGGVPTQAETGLPAHVRAKDQESANNWLLSPSKVPKPVAEVPVAAGGARPAAKKAAAKPASNKPAEEAASGDGDPAAGDGTEVKEPPSISRANTSTMHTPSDLPHNPPAEVTDLPPKDELDEEQDDEESEAEDRGDSGAAQVQTQTEQQPKRKRKEKTEAEKAAHARYMKFSRSLKRSLGCKCHKHVKVGPC